MKVKINPIHCREMKMERGGEDRVEVEDEDEVEVQGEVESEFEDEDELEVEDEDEVKVHKQVLSPRPLLILLRSIVSS